MNDSDNPNNDLLMSSYESLFENRSQLIIILHFCVCDISRNLIALEVGKQIRIQMQLITEMDKCKIEHAHPS